MNGIHGEKEKDKKNKKFTREELYQSSLIVVSLVFIFYNYV